MLNRKLDRKFDLFGWLTAHQMFRYLFLLPIVVMIMFVMTFMGVFDAIEEALLEQKRMEIRQDLNLIADQALAALGQNASWVEDEAEYRSHIINSIELLDKKHQTYAAAFVHSTDSHAVNQWGFSVITDRNSDTAGLSFDPFAFEEFRELIASNEHHEIVVRYEADEEGSVERSKKTALDMYLYFRWAPMLAGHPDRYLMVVGASAKTLEDGAFDSIGHMVIWMVVLTTLLNIALIAALNMLNPGARKQSNPVSRPLR
ncbi:hypothetical protein FACS1894184_05590 [Clostridia bacterium]|nr:hypothetical protein FACS1894184_05590 [Clostridia bacterium]